GRPQFVQSELAWDPSGPLADALLLYLDERNHTAGAPQLDTTGAHTGYAELASVSGTSPLAVHVDGAGVNRLGRGSDLPPPGFPGIRNPGLVSRTEAASTARRAASPPPWAGYPPSQSPSTPARGPPTACAPAPPRAAPGGCRAPPGRCRAAARRSATIAARRT